MLQRKTLSESGTETAPLDAEKLGQVTTALILERTTAPNSSVFENWMPPDTRTETTPLYWCQAESPGEQLPERKQTLRGSVRMAESSKHVNRV